MSFRVQYTLHAPDGDAPWGHLSVLLGSAGLDETDAVEREDGLWVLRQVPDQLRELADMLESGMTTGPPETWLGDA